MAADQTQNRAFFVDASLDIPDSSIFADDQPSDKNEVFDVIFKRAGDE
jgi:hypothetical protein